MNRDNDIPKITVIMPSLNVGKYIGACMQSVLNQTLYEIEVLAIDAGSTDGTLELLQKYAVMDERVKVIISEKRSYGYQVNVGIQHAHGEYIGIVETDDKITLDMYENLYQVAVETDADYVKGRGEYYVDLGNGESWSAPIDLPLQDESMLGRVIAPCEQPNLLISDIFLWNGIYKKNFLENIHLNETPGAAFQDQGFLLQTISRAKRAVYLDYIVYSYRQNNINSSIFNPKGFHYLVEEYARNWKYLIGIDDDWTQGYYRRLLDQSIGRFQMMAISSCFWEEAIIDMEVIRDRMQEAVKSGILRIENVGAERWKILQIWFKGHKELYKKICDKMVTRIENVHSICRRVKGHPVIIFGCGELGRFLYILLEDKSLGSERVFVDNNADLWGQKIQGTRVFSPEEVVKKYVDAVYVISNKKYVEQIKKQLLLLGVAEEQICLYDAGIHLNLLQIPLDT